MEISNKMKTAIYTRVSTEDQVREGYSLEVQREYLLNYAKQQDCEVFEVYSDEGISAGTTDRPALQKLLKDAKAKKFELVIVYKIDRFSRRLKDLIGLVDQLESYEVGFKSATEPFDTTTSAGKLMFQQLGSFAEFERNRLAERVFPGMVKSIQGGNWHGSRNCPTGYAYNKEKKLLEINKREANLVRLIYRLYLEGKSTTDIAEYLNKSKHETRVGRYFYQKYIRDILRNRIYIGEIVWNKYHYDKKQKVGKGHKYVKNDSSKWIVAKGKHQPIISVEDFEKVQKLLNENNLAPVRRVQKSKFAFSRLLYCEKCNYRFFGVSNIANHRTGERKTWYRCGGHQQRHVRCGTGAIREEVLEMVILSAINNMLDSDRLKGSRWTSMTDLQNQSETSISNADLASIRNALKENREKQLKLTDLYLGRHLSEDTFKLKNEALRQEEEVLRSKLAGLEILLLEKENSSDYLDRVKSYLASYDPQKKALSAADKKQILGLFLKKIVIKNAAKSAAAASRIVPFFYSPFNKLNLEEGSAINGNRKGKFAPILYQDLWMPDERRRLFKIGGGPRRIWLPEGRERRDSRHSSDQYLRCPPGGGRPGRLVCDV
jgi:site-specific DNA recombinase